MASTLKRFIKSINGNLEFLVQDMSIARIHSIALLTNGDLYAVGNNNYGQLGFGDTTDKTTWVPIFVRSNIIQAVCKSHTTLVALEDNTLWATGYNSKGELGLGDMARRSTFTRVTNLPAVSPIKQIACSEIHPCTMILFEDNTIWAAGSNFYGQLGLGDNSETYSSFTQVTNIPSGTIRQISCGSGSTFILLEDGTLWATGNNQYGKLGFGDTTYRNIFTKLNINNVTQVADGTYHSFILFTDNTLWGAGGNNNGQLGMGDYNDRTTLTRVTNLPSGTIRQIINGGTHSFILLKDGTLYGCGTNNYGQLGLGDMTRRNIFTRVTNLPSGNIKEVEAGYMHSFILFTDNTLWGCGWNEDGQLGLGDKTNRSTFTQVNI
jgi:alpha-tubulin suppressor-like RCC1 family protein